MNSYVVKIPHECLIEHIYFCLVGIQLLLFNAYMPSYIFLTNDMSSRTLPLPH